MHYAAHENGGADRVRKDTFFFIGHSLKNRAAHKNPELAASDLKSRSTEGEVHLRDSRECLALCRKLD